MHRGTFIWILSHQSIFFAEEEAIIHVLTRIFSFRSSCVVTGWFVLLGIVKNSHTMTLMMSFPDQCESGTVATT